MNVLGALHLKSHAEKSEEEKKYSKGIKAHHYESRRRKGGRESTCVPPTERNHFHQTYNEPW